MDLRNKKITVVGLGKSGTDSATLLDREGAIVSVTENGDSKDIRENAALLEKKFMELEIGKHTESFLVDTEIMVVSPGVCDTSLPIRYAEENNIPVISELELGFLFCKGPIVAVTGTNGKSTVVSLIGKILSKAGKPVNVCGNIGNSFSGEIEKIDKKTFVILEVSSFQLERIAFFKPKISVILNATEDHLDRYSTFDEYLRAKKKIFQNQKESDTLILNYDDKNLKKLAKAQKIIPKVLYFSTKEKVEGIYKDGDSIKVHLKNKVKRLFDLGDFKLKGVHNTENILAAALTATLLGVDKLSMESATREFNPLLHRFQKVVTLEDVEFIDDSKATNIDSTEKALLSLKRPAILIAGGKDKNLSYKKLLPVVKKKVKKMVLIGQTRPKMRDVFKCAAHLEEADTLQEAVRIAYKQSSPGDCVLLSPMCSSFDMFKDYKERGEVFKQAVEKLRRKVKAKD